MIRIHYNQHTLIICEPGQDLLQDPNGVLWFSQEVDSLRSVPEFFEAHPAIERLYLPTRHQQEVFEKIARLHHQIHAAGGLVSNLQGDYLLIHRLGKWDLPKGKQEPGEDIRQTALREVEEECGLHALQLTAPLCTTYHTYRMDGKICFKHTHWFSMQTASQTPLTPQTEEDITQAIWVAPQDLAQPLANTFPSILEVFRHAGLDVPLD